MIRITGLKKSFVTGKETWPILDVPGWQVEAGARVALLGPSGSGKSTLLHLIGGLLPADQGEVMVAGKSISSMKEAERDRFRAENIGYVMQDFYLLPSLTALQNIEFAIQGASNRKERRSLAADWLEKVGLEGRMHHLPGQLSRGQQQRVAIVRALVNHPPVVLADEPTGSLDYETAGAVMRLLLALCEEQRQTLIAVTHDLQLAKLFPQTAQMSALNRLLGPSSLRTVPLNTPVDGAEEGEAI